MGFQRWLEERLNNLRSHLKEDPGIIAERMMQGRFERIKCNFGTAASDLLPTFELSVPDLPPGSNFPAHGITDSKMVISRYGALSVMENGADFGTRNVLKTLFDEQVDKILSLTDSQFERLQRKDPREQIVELAVVSFLTRYLSDHYRHI